MDSGSVGSWFLCLCWCMGALGQEYLQLCRCIPSGVLTIGALAYKSERRDGLDYNTVRDCLKVHLTRAHLASLPSVEHESHLRGLVPVPLEAPLLHYYKARKT
jgi:hypothetical protein